MADTSDPRYRRIQNLVRLGEASASMDAKEWEKLLASTQESVGRLTTQAQKSQDSLTNGIVRGVSSIEASQTSGVNSATLATWRDFQDNLTKLQTSMVEGNTAATQAARSAATQAAGAFDPKSATWRKAYLQALGQQLGDGSLEPKLYGTMRAAMGDVGLNPDDPASWTAMLDLARAAGPATEQAFREEASTYAEMSASYEATNRTLHSMSALLQDAPPETGNQAEDDRAVQSWMNAHRQDYANLAAANTQFKSRALPSLQNKDGALSVNVQANINPDLQRAIDEQQAVYRTLVENPPGSGDKEAVPEDDRLMALFVDNDRTRRLADQYGLGLGHVEKVEDPTKLDEFKARFPSGVYIPGIGIYVPGPDDLEALHLAHEQANKRGPFADPFMRRPPEKPNFGTVQVPRPGGGVKKVDYLGLEEVGSDVFAWIHGSDGKVYRVNVDTGDFEQKDAVPSTVTPLDTWAKQNNVEGGVDAVRGTLDAQANFAKLGEGTDSYQNVLLQPNLYRDDVGDIRFLDPTTGDSRTVKNGRLVATSGGEPRPTLGRLLRIEAARMRQKEGERAPENFKAVPLRPNPPAPPPDQGPTGAPDQVQPPDAVPAATLPNMPRFMTAPPAPVQPSVEGATVEEDTSNPEPRYRQRNRTDILRRMPKWPALSGRSPGRAADPMQQPDMNSLP